MTRAKEITKEAKKFAKEIDDKEIAEDVQDAFEQGAEWADAHPDIDVRTMAAWQSGYNEAIDKACEWLENDFEELTKLHLDDIVIDKFRKAMKGGEK